MTRLLLVRHGQSAWNAEGRWQGQADPPLSPLGLAQAHRAAARLLEVEGIAAVRAVAASDLQRARVTAELLAAALGIGEVLALPGLRERFAGPWQGLTHAEIAARWPGSPAGTFRPPGWEEDAVVAARAARALTTLAAPTLVVAHEGVIRTLEADADEGPLPNLGARWFTTQPLRPSGRRLLLLAPAA